MWRCMKVSGLDGWVSGWVVMVVGMCGAGARRRCPRAGAEPSGLTLSRQPLWLTLLQNAYPVLSTGLASMLCCQRCTLPAVPVGPEAPRHRIYLSAATLVIVPKAELIEHWRHQIRQNVRRQAAGEEPLRVLVYTVEGVGVGGRLEVPGALRLLASGTHSTSLAATSLTVLR